MVKNYASANRQIQIDECYSCGGKFLDNGELQAIRAEFETEDERSAATMRELYDTVGVKLRAMEDEQKEANAKRSPLNKLFRAMIYGSKSGI